jgi:hypothetical protein
MPYAPLPRITLADAMADNHPLFVDTCPCVECSPQGHRQTPQATIDAKPSESTGAPAKRGAPPTSKEALEIQVDVLRAKIARKYGR